MNFTLTEQMWCLLWSFVCGVALGMVYDVFRALRTVVKGGRAFVFCCDFLFMILCAFVSVFFSIGFSRGNTRYFIVIGEICGFLLLRLTLGRVSVRAFEYIYSKAVKFIKIVTEYLSKTAKRVLQLIRRLLYNISRKKLAKAQGYSVKESSKRGKRHHGVKTAE